MDAGDDERKGSLPSIIIESHSNANEDRLSPEDLAWADSCLVQDVEVLESNWNSFKDALLEVLDNHPESLSSSVTESDCSPGGPDVKMLPSIEEAEPVMYPARTGDNIFVDPINEEAKTNIDDTPIENNTDIPSQVLREDVVESFQGDPFLPTYSEDQRAVEAVDSGLESLPVNDVDLSTNDIFRVWDLNIAAHEEFDLVKQLKKALQEVEDQKIERPFDGVEDQIKTPTSDDSVVRKDVKENSLDQIVTGIAELSLNQDSS
ncbi:hypothetical protein SLA2020_054470 [Shorea laevis]